MARTWNSKERCMIRDICCRNCKHGKLLEQKTPTARRTMLIVRCRKFAPPEHEYGFLYPCVDCDMFEPKEEA